MSSNRKLALVAVLTVLLVYSIGYGVVPLIPKLKFVPIEEELLAVRNDSKSSCLRDAFSDIVLVIVYHFPLYSSIPTLTALYKNAFPTIMYCGPQKNKSNLVEALDVNKGYFAYMCMSRAMEKYPGYAGYLQISDDVLLNYWNLVGVNRDKIRVYPRYPIGIKGWYWWNSRWGWKTCRKAYNEIWSLRKRDRSSDPLRVINGSVDLLKRSKNWSLLCDRGRSDIFYIPGKFADAYQNLSHIFHKHQTFLEIAVPTMCRILDKVENFQYIRGVYLPGKSADGQSELFWKKYDKTRLVFIHPFKLSFKHDGALNKELIRNWILEYSDNLSKC